MSRKGCSPENAACEGVFGRLKNELFYPRNWQITSIEQFTKELDSYIQRADGLIFSFHPTAPVHNVM